MPGLSKDREAHTRALAHLALHRDVAAKRSHQQRTNHEPQTTAHALLPIGIAALLERLEQAMLRWHINPRAGIGDLEIKPQRIAFACGAHDVNVNPNRALDRKFKRIHQEIYQHLAQHALVGMKGRRHIAVDVYRQRNRGLVLRRTRHADGVVHTIAQSKCMQHGGDHAGL